MVQVASKGNAWARCGFGRQAVKVRILPVPLVGCMVPLGGPSPRQSQFLHL